MALEEGQLVEALGALSSDLRGIGCDLLLYKALLGGPWFEALARVDPREDAQTLRRIGRETTLEAERAIVALTAWNATDPGRDELGATLRARLFEDLLFIKESTVEAFLRAGMSAPTEGLRREFLRLADIDRLHANELRAALGTTRTVRQRADAIEEGAAVGAHSRREGDGPLTARVQRIIAQLRSDGQELSSIVLSPPALRHLRDEGTLGPDETMAFGLPVEVDFGWRGECFAIRSRDHAALAELVLARKGSGVSAHGAAGT